MLLPSGGVINDDDDDDDVDDVGDAGDDSVLPGDGIR